VETPPTLPVGNTGVPPPPGDGGGCGRDARAPQGRAVASTEFIHIPNTFSARGLRKSMQRAYITRILVIFDGNRLRPAAAGAQENLS